MLQIKKIVFVDEDSQKEVTVSIDGKVETSSSEGISHDEYFTASFYTGLLMAGGFAKVKEFIEK